MISVQTAAVITAIIFTAGILIPLFMKKHNSMIRVPLWVSSAVLILSFCFAARLFHAGPYLFFGSLFVVDHLAVFHVFLVNIIFFSASVYMQDYFSDEFSVFHYRRFSMLWQGFQMMLLVVILSNNIGLTWIAVEATTIISAFLIISETDSLSLEAMWKYLLVCSVGIGLAFIGTIIVVAAGREVSSSEAVYTFTSLSSHASELNPELMLFAFIFIVAGYGTKAGLAPMHTWLPDAHSQSPTPVSAVFSCVMLNTALFVIMRYLPVVDNSMGGGRAAHSILLLLGFLSLLFSAVFIPVQKDVKRLLAYCSIEHIGIIAIGLGLGGGGIFAALFHTVNHSVSKMTAFFSAGSIISSYGTRDMRKISGVLKTMPVRGSVFLISMLVLIGVAPFSVFLSEFMIVKTAFQQGRYILFGLFLLGALAIFISILKYIFDMVFSPYDGEKLNIKKIKTPEKIILFISLSVLLVAGLWLPQEFQDFLSSASSIIETGIKL
jgi:hydrogenase-4 component F